MTDNKIVPLEQKAITAKWVKLQNSIYDDYVKGEQNYTTLAKKHKVTRADAIQAVEEVKEYVNQTGAFKEMAKERLYEMDHHYSMLIKEGWDAIEEMKSSNGKEASKIATTIKAIADIEAKRQEALQKSGMYDDFEMGDMLAESERKIDLIKALLKDVLTKFPETKTMIMNGLRDIQDPDRLPDPDTIEGQTSG